MAIVLDRYFVHRIRAAAGKTGTRSTSSIKLSLDDFERLADAFFDEMKRKFV